MTYAMSSSATSGYIRNQYRRRTNQARQMASKIIAYALCRLHKSIDLLRKHAVIISPAGTKTGNSYAF